MKSIIGYVLSGVGIFGIILTFESVRTLLNITLPEQLTNTNLTIISAVLLVAGVFFLVKKKGKSKHKESEVPIYKGKEIVGYRRA